MGKRGPTPLPEHLRRRHRVGVWLSETELDDLEARLSVPGLAALVMHGGRDERSGMKVVSQHMRARILCQSVRLSVPEINRQAYANLGRIGSNINQIAAAFNSGLLNASDRQTFGAVLDEISELRTSLLNAKSGLASGNGAGALNDEFEINFD
jgi:hypothetical protein